MQTPINLLPRSLRIQMAGRLGAYALPAWLHFGVIALGGNAGTDGSDVLGWAIGVPLLAFVWSFSIGREISSEYRLLVGLFGLLLYLYALLLLFWFGGAIFLAENSVWADLVACFSFLAAFPYARELMLSSKLALDLGSDVEMLRKEDHRE